MEKKYDFQNIDVKLYLALRTVLKEFQSLSDNGDAGNLRIEEDDWAQNAYMALEEFELSHGPLPGWAIARNWDYSLVPGAQLCTKDGRRTGNAHILRVKDGCLSTDNKLYDCITDAGSFIQGLSESEILESYYIGDWISDPKTLIARFGNHGEDYGLLQEGEPNGK